MTNSDDLVLNSIDDNTGCFTNPQDSVFVNVNELPFLNILLDDICENVEPFAFSDAEPVGGSFYLDNQLTDSIFPSSLM